MFFLNSNIFQVKHRCVYYALSKSLNNLSTKLLNKNKNKTSIEFYEYLSSQAALILSRNELNAFLFVQIIRAHRVLLSAGSGYLEKVLAMNPSDHPTVVLSNIRYKELKLLVDFMYSGRARCRISFNPLYHEQPDTPDLQVRIQ